MEIDIKIPSVGESVREAVIAQWYRQDGDRVRKDEPLFVIETDKVTLEIVAEADGVLRILAPAGTTVAIGAVVGTIAAEVVAVKPAEPALADRAVKPPPFPAAPEKPAAPLAAAEPVAAEPAQVRVRPILAPSVRHLVAAKHLDVSAITGTGPGNRITKGDVLLYLEQMQALAGPRPAN